MPIVFILFSLASIEAQNSYVDSLLKQINGKDLKTDFVNHSLLSQSFRYTDITRSAFHANEALQIAIGLNDNSGKAESYYNLGAVNILSNNYSEADENLQNGLLIAQKEDNKKMLFHFNDLLGTRYKMTSEVNKSLQYFDVAIAIADELEDESKKLTSLANLGSLYVENNNEQLGRKYLAEALQLAKAKNLIEYYPALYNNLATISENHDSNYYYLQGALYYAKKANNQYGLAFYHNNLGSYYHTENINIDSASYHYKQSEKQATKYNDQYSLAVAHLNLGDLYIVKNELVKAEQYLNDGIVKLQKLKSREKLKEGYQYLAKLYGKKGDFQNQSLALKQLINLQDSLFEEESANQLILADAKYQAKEKEAIIAKQESEIVKNKALRLRTMFWAALLSSILFALFIYTRYRKRVQLNEAKLAFESQKLAVDQWRELNQFKSSLFSNISHELRTPLTLILGPIKELLAKKTMNPDYIEKLELSNKNGQKMTMLIDELLDLSKLQEQKQELKLQSYSFEEILKNIFYSYKGLAESKNQNYIFSSTINNEEECLIDKVMTEKIMSNLISNAIKYTPQNGTIEVKLNRIDNCYSLLVSDNGPGIPQKEKSKIFERFYRAQSLDNAQVKGLGIGLALSKELAELMGHSIQLEESIKEGAAFKYLVPITLAKAIKEEIESSTSTIKSQYSFDPDNSIKKSILLVEDNIEIADYVSGLLADEYKILHVENGVKALAFLDSNIPDLIISDIMMPEMDGFTFKEKLNKKDSAHLTPFIFLTAKSLASDKISGLRLGVDDYIVKPFDPTELRVRISNLLNNSASRKDEDPLEISELTAEQNLLELLELEVINNLDNVSFKVQDLSNKAAMSERNLRRVIKSLTGLTPIEFIMEIRLQKARQILESKKFKTVMEVMFEVGLESASYFSKVFLKRFGKSPSDLL